MSVKLNPQAAWDNLMKLADINPLLIVIAAVVAYIVAILIYTHRSEAVAAGVLLFSATILFTTPGQVSAKQIQSLNTLQDKTLCVVSASWHLAFWQEDAIRNVKECKYRDRTLQFDNPDKNGRKKINTAERELKADFGVN